MNDSFDPDFGTALAAASAIRARQISSRELTEHTFARIDAFQPKLNAYVYQLREEALAAAYRADEALARDDDVGIFHGVPVNVKESFGVEGQTLYLGLPWPEGLQGARGRGARPPASRRGQRAARRHERAS
jgi:Asp-tRNA(Asn)/Glu-tRNA(Gln) amidotransferase A subunit family amidase